MASVPSEGDRSLRFIGNRGVPVQANSAIFCFRFDIPGWPEKLSEPLMADDICNRFVYDAYTVVIGGKKSQPKRKVLQDA